MKSALVTGHTGFIGQHLYRALTEKGVEVQVISRATHQGGIGSAQVLNSLVKGKDVVFHLAGNPSVWIAKGDPMLDCETNIVQSLKVLETCSRCNSKIVFPSTIQVYAFPEKEGESLTEKSSTQPVEFYGVSKLTVENYIRVYHRYSRLRGMVLRIPWVYGKDVKRGILADLLYPPGPPPIQLYHSLDDVFDFIHVDDVVEAMIKAADAELEYGTFNISSGKPVRCKEVVEIFNKEVHSRPSHRNHRAVLDSQLARKTLGWQPKHDFLTDAKTWWSSR